MVRNYHSTRNNGFTPYGYSRKNKELVRLNDAGKRLLLGFELECSFSDVYYGDCDEDEVSDAVIDEVGSYVGTEHDGSVENGFETVSMPMTLAAHVESDWINRLCSVLQRHGAEEGENGLHVHISRAGLGSTVDSQDLAIAKMMLMLDRFEYEYVRLARRNYHDSGWAYRVNVERYAKHSDTLVDAARESGDDRYHSLNITNRNTVEFRIFASTARPERIKATLELVHATATYCITNTLPVIRDGSWDDFCVFVGKGKYKYLPDYMRERNVWSAYANEVIAA